MSESPLSAALLVDRLKALTAKVAKLDGRMRNLAGDVDDLNDTVQAVGTVLYENDLVDEDDMASMFNVEVRDEDGTPLSDVPTDNGSDDDSDDDDSEDDSG